MAIKTITESSHAELSIVSDGTAGGTSARCRVGAPELVTDHAIDVAAALASAAAALGGGATAAQVRATVVAFFAACRAQARAAGGWS